ncbi:hypothetical protein F4809DRAFT_130579 [Biscogniauxia mediterranea]|nr:hypothetical protein F4809DRAFT_130579 [Biscogniauxia mediterranea]
MSLFLQLPREIRDNIAKWVTLLPSIPPPDPATLTVDDRLHLQDLGMRWGGVLDRIRVPEQQTPHSLLPLMLVNRQLYSEVKEVMQLLSQTSDVPDYTLDVVYLKNCTLWPTWLSLPRPSPVLRTLYIQFRIFDLPDQLREMGWSYQDKPGSVYTPGNYLPSPIACLFHGFFAQTLERGPLFAGDGSGKGLMARRMVLDFLPTEGDLRPLGEYARRRNSRRKRDFFAMDDGWRPRSAELAAPEMLLHYVRGLLRFLLECVYLRHPYGRVLYARVGEVELRLGGEVVENLEIPDMFSQIPFPDMLGSDYGEGVGTELLSWKETVAVKRQEAGFPDVAPYEEH